MSRAGLLAPALVAAAWLAGCEGTVGLIDLEIVHAPGADPLAEAELVRLALDNPPRVVEAERGGDGSFALSLEVSAEGQAGRVALEAFDAGGTLVAVGETGALPIGPIDASIAIYVAAPDSIAEAPVQLEAARSEFQSAQLSFGTLWAGGRNAGGVAVDDLVIYNVYQHVLQVGESLPAPRARMTAVAGAQSFVYLFGGLDREGEAAGTFWRFSTNVPPAGFYVELDVDEDLARAGAGAAVIGTELFLATGEPGVFLDGAFGAVNPAEAPPLDGEIAALIADGITALSLVVGAGAGSEGAVLFANGVFTDLTGVPVAVARTDHALVRLPSADALVIGGANPEGELLASVAIYRRQEQRFDVLGDTLATPRTGAAVAVAGGRVLVAGGTDADGNVVDHAEIFDATTLEPLGTAPLVVPRTGAVASPLGNRQIVIAGGVDATGAPTAVIELFTPGP